MDDYESVLCVKNEVFVYRIPARSSNRGYKAADWKLDAPDWTGRLRVVSKGKLCFIKLDDKLSGDLFAESPVDTYPGVAVEQVMDSSRYFVIRIKDPSGRHAFIGIGFADRGDSFDLIVALQDHFKQLKREEGAAQAEADLTTGPKLDLRFKEGQTIKININTNKGDDDDPRKKRPRGSNMGGSALLPPPPGGVKIAAPRTAPAPTPAATSQSYAFSSSAAPTATAAKPAGGASNLDLLLDFGTSPAQQSSSASHMAQPQPTDPWGDFTSASNSQSQQQAPSGGGGWINFN